MTLGIEFDQGQIIPSVNDEQGQGQREPQLTIDDHKQLG